MENNNLYDIESEQVVLGSFIINSDYYYKITEILTEECFYEKVHQEIFKLLKDFYEKDNIKDLKALSKKIELICEKFKLQKYLSVLLNMGAGVVDVEGYCKIIKDFYLKRKLDNLCQKIQKNLKDNNIAEDIYNKTEKEFNEVIEKATSDKYDFKSLNEICAERIIEIEDIVVNNKEPQNIIKTNIIDYDRNFGGIIRKNLTILAARANCGKALPLDTKILTKSGWVKNKDVKVGDYVVDHIGKLVKVLGVYPQGIRQCYKITFSDGRIIECDENHLWEIFNPNFEGPRVLDTKLLYGFYQGRNKSWFNKTSIRLFNGEYGIEKDFIIHPYLLGVLLGDGDITKICRWTKPDLEIKEKIETLIDKDYVINCHNKNGDSFAIVKKKDLKQKNNIYIDELRRLELLGKRGWEKSIPEEYLHTTREQRIELLNGILDTDGCIDNKGGIQYTTSSKILAEQVQQLAWSLGLKCSLNIGKSFCNGERKRDRYRIYISGNKKTELFFLKRKKEKSLEEKQKDFLSIKKIEKIDKKETQCIYVDSPEHLYVAENYVVTHNTTFALQIGLNVAEQGLNVLFFSQEMCANEQGDKILSNFSSINSMNFRDSKITSEQISEVKNIMQKKPNMNLYINEAYAINTNFIKKTLQNFEKKIGKIDLVIIDHLQIMTDNTNNNSNNRVLTLSNISMDCKNIAKEYDCGLILLSQLSRKTEEREDPRPQLSDLRESGAIEQNADTVMFLFRESYYTERKLNGLNENSSEFEALRQKFEIEKNQADLTVQKNRSGQLGAIKLYFNPEYSKFTDMTGYLLAQSNPYL